MDPTFPVYVSSTLASLKSHMIKAGGKNGCMVPDVKAAKKKGCKRLVSYPAQWSRNRGGRGGGGGGGGTGPPPIVQQGGPGPPINQAPCYSI